MFVATVGSLIFEKRDSQLLVRNSFRGKPWKKPMPRGRERCFFSLSFFLSFFQSARKKPARVFSNSEARFDLKCVNSARQAGGQSIRGRLELMRRVRQMFREKFPRHTVSALPRSRWTDRFRCCLSRRGEKERIKSRVG